MFLSMWCVKGTIEIVYFHYSIIRLAFYVKKKDYIRVSIRRWGRFWKFLLNNLLSLDIPPILITPFSLSVHNQYSGPMALDSSSS